MLTGLCLNVVNLPADIAYGRILPALGIAQPLGNLYYAYLAWRLAKNEGRADVTAMPYGPSVPHMFIVVFLIMLEDARRRIGVAIRSRVVPCHRRDRAAGCFRRPHGAKVHPPSRDARHSRRPQHAGDRSGDPANISAWAQT